MRIDVHLDAPRASEPSLKPFGIARIDSSLAVMTTGSAIIANVNQPAIMDTPHPKKRTNIPKPNRPKTIEGTPDKFKTDNLIIRKTRPGRLYSLR